MIQLNFAENDCQGNFSGKVKRIELPEIVTFESIYFEGQNIIRIYNKFKMHNRIFAYENISEWVGNIAWNSYSFHDIEAAKLINSLWKSDKWSKDNIDSEFEKHMAFASILPADLAAFTSIHRFD